MGMTEKSAIDKARGFLHLPPGWCHGQEVPPTERTVEYACQWIEEILSLRLDVDVFPGDDDSIVISAMRGERSLDFEVSGDAILCYTEESGVGLEYEEIDAKDSPSRRDILEKLHHLCGFVLRDCEDIAYISNAHSYFSFVHNVVDMQSETYNWKTLCMSEYLTHGSITSRKEGMSNKHLSLVERIYQCLMKHVPSRKVIRYVDISKENIESCFLELSQSDSCESVIKISNTAKNTYVQSSVSPPLPPMISVTAG